MNRLVSKSMADVQERTSVIGHFASHRSAQGAAAATGSARCAIAVPQ